MIFALPIAFDIAATAVAAVITEYVRKNYNNNETKTVSKPQSENKPMKADTSVEAKIEEALKSKEFQYKIADIIKSNSPEIVSAFNELRKDENLSAVARQIYESQIIVAQEFVNQNKKADISRLRDLMRRMMPQEFHKRIDNIKEGQDPKTLINIHGGQTQILPNATKAVQGK